MNLTTEACTRSCVTVSSPRHATPTVAPCSMLARCIRGWLYWEISHSYKARQGCLALPCVALHHVHVHAGNRIASLFTCCKLRCVERASLAALVRRNLAVQLYALSEGWAISMPVQCTDLRYWGPLVCAIADYPLALTGLRDGIQNNAQICSTGR